MNNSFQALLDGTVDEIVRREPEYFKRFAVSIAPPARVAQELINDHVILDHPVNEIEQAFSEGLSYFTSRGIRLEQENGQRDPVGDVLLRSIADAFSVAHGQLPLVPSAQLPAFSDVMQQEYEQRQTADGIRYFVRRRGTRPLLLITATGIPLGIWSRLLADEQHDFRVMAVEARCSNLLTGGIQQFTDLAADAADIAKVLEAESLRDVNLVGWCNGGRLAIEMASRCASQIRSLVLVGPALGGFKGVPRTPSRFEASMKKVFSVLAQKPRLAAIYVKSLQEQPPDWASLVDPQARASALFGMQPRDQAAALQSPMAEAESLLNYGRRLTADGDHPIEEAFSRIEQPVMLITGSDDGQVSNEFTLAVLRSRTWKTPVAHADILGAGHYPHYLQYPYFRLLLQSFLVDEHTPAPMARVRVQMIS